MLVLEFLLMVLHLCDQSLTKLSQIEAYVTNKKSTHTTVTLEANSLGLLDHQSSRSLPGSYSCPVLS